MEKVLPMYLPPGETYQETAFLMGAILQNESVRDAFYNSYINTYAEINEQGELVLEFAGADCETYRQKGIGEMDLFYLKNIAREKCADFLKERMEQDNYLLLFSIDEYEISYSEYYRKKHFEHDTYLYGYDENDFFVMAYSDGHLKMMKVAQKEIVDSLYSHQEYFEDTQFCSFRIHHCAKENLNIEKIDEEIEAYLKGGFDEAGGRMYGITTYDFVHELIAYVREQNPEEKLSPKVFRMLWEHKKIMRIRNQHLKQFINGLETIESSIEKIEKLGSLMLMLTIKYNLKKDVEILDNIQQRLCDMMEMERSYLHDFRKILKKEYSDSRKE